MLTIITNCLKRNINNIRLNHSYQYKINAFNIINKAQFSTSNSNSTTTKTTNQVKFIFINRDGTKTPVKASPGQHILQVAKKNDVQLQGACQASLACSTCHVILPKNVYDKLQNALDEEQDLLDLAFGLTPTSRLGCQVKICEQMQGCEVILPKASRNLYVDGTKPSSH